MWTEGRLHLSSDLEDKKETFSVQVFSFHTTTWPLTCVIVPHSHRLLDYQSQQPSSQSHGLTCHSVGIFLTDAEAVFSQNITNHMFWGQLISGSLCRLKASVLSSTEVAAQPCGSVLKTDEARIQSDTLQWRKKADISGLGGLLATRLCANRSVTMQWGFIDLRPSRIICRILLTCKQCVEKCAPSWCKFCLQDAALEIEREETVMSSSFAPYLQHTPLWNPSSRVGGKTSESHTGMFVLYSCRSWLTVPEPKVLSCVFLISSSLLIFTVCPPQNSTIRRIYFSSSHCESPQLICKNSGNK